MILQISLFTKAPMTNVAFKRPSTGVDISMGFEITRRWERFAAHCTFMWLFLNMCHFVVIQIARSSEPFATNSALMRFLATMNTWVFRDEDVENPLVHMSQTWGRSPVWILIWRLSKLGRSKALPQ